MYEYTHHPVNNHQYLDFGEEHKWRKSDWAKTNMKKLDAIKQTKLPKYILEAHYTKEVKQ